MDENQLRSVLREEVNRILTALGIDPDKPHHSQQDMHWLRKKRLDEEKDQGWFKKASRPVLVTGGLTALWHGIISFLKEQ